MRAGISPDAVVSIDCQIHGYHHFMQGIPERAALYLDLASPPLFARGRKRVFFVAGNHPFATWLGARWRRLATVDTSGGNVTHAAVSLALNLGATDITLYGADFSYPAGKAYARGTYLFDYFGVRADRVQAIESGMYSLVFRTGDARGERAGGHLRYTTALLSSYRERLLELVQGSGARFHAVEGEGLPLASAGISGHSPAVALIPRIDTGGTAGGRCGWRDALEEYAWVVSRLPGLADPPWASLGSLAATQLEAWSTLLPVAARITRESREPMTPAATLDAARSWALAKVRRILDSPIQAGEPHE